MQRKLVGDKGTFAIEYAFCEDSRSTELSMYVAGKNILAFERDGERLTTCWNLDELTIWLRKFIDEMTFDPYPVNCEGIFAAQKDDNARDFDSDDDELFEAYYQRLYDWNLRHRWHSASSGAVLADVYFQLVGDSVEISWDSRNVEGNVIFTNLSGGREIPKEQFCTVVNTFLREYALQWFN